MSEENKTPKVQPQSNEKATPIEKSQINETYNKRSEIGDLSYKNKGEGHYAKPFINEVIQPTPDKGADSSNNNTDK